MPSGRVVASPYSWWATSRMSCCTLICTRERPLAVVHDDRGEVPRCPSRPSRSVPPQQRAEGGHQERVVERRRRLPRRRAFRARGARVRRGLTGARTRRGVAVADPPSARPKAWGCPSRSPRARPSAWAWRRRWGSLAWASPSARPGAARDVHPAAGAAQLAGGERDSAAYEGQGQHASGHGGDAAAAHGAPPLFQRAVHQGGPAETARRSHRRGAFPYRGRPRTGAGLRWAFRWAWGTTTSRTRIGLLDSFDGPKGPQGPGAGGARASAGGELRDAAPSCSRSRPSARTQRVRTAAGLTRRAAAVSSMLRSSQYLRTTTARSLGASWDRARISVIRSAGSSWSAEAHSGSSASGRSLAERRRRWVRKVLTSTVCAHAAGLSIRRARPHVTYIRLSVSCTRSSARCTSPLVNRQAERNRWPARPAAEHPELIGTRTLHVLPVRPPVPPFLLYDATGPGECFRRSAETFPGPTRGAPRSRAGRRERGAGGGALAVSVVYPRSHSAGTCGGSQPETAWCACRQR